MDIIKNIIIHKIFLACKLKSCHRQKVNILLPFLISDQFLSFGAFKISPLGDSKAFCITSASCCKGVQLYRKLLNKTVKLAQNHGCVQSHPL